MTPNNNFQNDNENMGGNVRLYISTIGILLSQVKNATKKTAFNQRLLRAAAGDNENALRILMKDLGEYIQKMSGRTRREAVRKGPVYSKPPTFDQAVIDLVHQLCGDLENFPNLSDYYAEVNKTLFEEVDAPSFSGRRGCGLFGSDNEDEYLEEDFRAVDSIETIVKRDMVVASASCQSGKSLFMICAGIKGMVTGKVPVFVTRNVTGDANQLESNCQNFANILEAYLTKHGVAERKFTIETLRADSLDLPTYRQKALDAFNGQEMKIIICLGNSTQLERVVNLAKETSGSINLFIDEVDYVDYGENSETAELLSELKEYAYQTCGLTATPLTVMFNEEDLKSKNQLRLKPPSDYRGFVDFIYRPLEKEVSALNKKASYNEIIQGDPNLEKFLRKFSKSKPDYAYKLKENIPNICLLKNSRFIENQESLFDGITKKFKQMAVIVYNGGGTKIHAPGITLEGYRKMNISDALQYLRDNGGVQKFPRIIIIAGDLAGRCISYVPTDYSWHLTDMYYVPAASTPVPELIQSAGRLCGRNRCKGHLHLHAPLKVIDALFKGYKFTDEVIDRAIASPLIQNGEEKSFAESIKSIPMNKDKAPPASRKLVTKADVRKGDFNLVKGKDGGVPMSQYQYRTEETEGEVRPEKTEEKQEEGGKYFLILEDNITAPLAKKILDAAEKVIIDAGKIGKTVLKSWINDQILSKDIKCFKNRYQINGTWTAIYKKKRSCQLNQTGLIFWKDKERVCIRLNL